MSKRKRSGQENCVIRAVLILPKYTNVTDYGRQTTDRQHLMTIIELCNALQCSAKTAQMQACDVVKVFNLITAED